MTAEGGREGGRETCRRTWPAGLLGCARPCCAGMGRGEWVPCTRRMCVMWCCPVQALGDTGDHWALASDIIRQHLEGNISGHQIRGTHPAAAASSSNRCAAATAASASARSAAAGSAGGRESAGQLAAAQRRGGKDKKSASAADRHGGRGGEENGAGIAKGKIKLKESKAYGADKGLCEDGITLSLAELKTKIDAAGRSYSCASKTIKEMSKGELLRATQRKTVTSKPGVGGKAPASSRQEDEQVGEQPKTWASKVKGMRKAAADINPLVAMAAKARPSASPSKLHSSRPASAAAAVSVSRDSAAPGSSHGVKRPSSAMNRPRAAATSVRGEKERNGKARPAMTSNGAKGSPSKARASGRKEVWGADDAQRNVRQQDAYLNDTARGNEDQGLVGAADMYARDEAIGARPKSRRGRGVNGRGADDDLQHMAAEAPMMGDDEMVARRENGGFPEADGDQQDAYGDAAGSVYALDEAQGTRPKSRRGRGIRTRNGACASVVEPQMGDDETRYHVHVQPHVEDGDPGGGLELLPKIDEAASIRPPSRRGRPPSRASLSAGARPSTAGGTRPGSAGNSMATAELGDAMDAGRELFSDCTTPDAPDPQVGWIAVMCCACAL